MTTIRKNDYFFNTDDGETVVARSLDGLQKRAAKLRRQGVSIGVGTNAWRQVGSAPDGFAQRVLNAI